MPATPVTSPVDQALLDALQDEFPLSSRPYLEVGEQIGLVESEVLHHVERLRSDGIIRQISAIFDTRKLGYASSLVAAQVDPDRIEAAAAVVSAHPGVSHNYERNHRYNLWFTMAVPPGGSLEETLEGLSERAGFERYRILPSTRVFRIGVRFRMGGHGGAGRKTRHGASEGGGAQLTAFDKACIRELQEDFPTVECPYAPMAKRLGIEEDDLFGWARRMTEEGRLRRVAAVLRHRAAGFRANAMVVWDVPDDRIEEIGTFCGEIEAVSHCYQRPTFDDWPYSLYTMIHGRTESDCESVIGRILGRFGDLPRALLYSTREFKKERVRYFVEETDAA